MLWQSLSQRGPAAGKSHSARGRHEGRSSLQSWAEGQRIEAPSAGFKKQPVPSSGNCLFAKEALPGVAQLLAGSSSAPTSNAGVTLYGTCLFWALPGVRSHVCWSVPCHRQPQVVWPGAQGCLAGCSKSPVQATVAQEEPGGPSLLLS